MSTFNPSFTSSEVSNFAEVKKREGWNENDRLLYRRIMDFDIDGDQANVSFAERLARENRWSLAFSKRVIHEYKRFVFLVVTGDHPLTPSDQVDQAWHLHLTYSRSYWDRFCAETLGRPLHHGPTRGGAVEASKFRAWYGDTLKRYQCVFLTPPPRDIWPDAAIRFGDEVYFQRVNTRRYWFVQKPSSLVTYALLAVSLWIVLKVKEGLC